jgi:hypothetical protein
MIKRLAFLCALALSSAFALIHAVIHAVFAIFGLPCPL